MSVVLLRGDARELPLPDASVDLIVTSPPYYGQRDYRDNGESLAGQIGSEETPREYLHALLECTREWMRVLKPSGSLFVNLGDKYSQRIQVRRSSHQPGIFPGKFEEFGETWAERAAKGATRMPHQNVINDAGDWVLEKSLMQLPQRYSIACTDQLGLILRRDNIWSKSSGMPESVTDRCATRHEYLLHLVKHPRYFAAVDEIKLPLAAPGRKAGANAFRARDASAPRSATGAYEGQNALGALPGSVWEMAAAPLVVPEHVAHASCCGGRKREGCEDGLDHYAVFPAELPRRVILGWSPSGICLECGEGRRPVTRRELIPLRPGDKPGRNTLNGEAVHGFDRRAGTHVLSQNTITGYACTCTPCTDHPERRGKDFHAGTDRARGMNDRNGGERYRRYVEELENPRGPVHEYHFDEWSPAPARPAVVLDPFSGTGTSLLVASALGRIGIGIDRSMDYCRLAKWRTADPGEIARAMEVPKPPKQVNGQMSMFDGVA